MLFNIAGILSAEKSPVVSIQHATELTLLDKCLSTT